MLPPDLERALTFERELLGRAAARYDEHELGFAIHDPAHPRVWQANELHVLRGSPSPADLVAFQRAVIYDPAVADLLVPSLGEAGFVPERVVYLVLRRERDREPPPGQAREIADEEEFADLERRCLAEEPYGADGGLVREISSARSRRRDAVERCSRVIGLDGGAPAGVTTLFAHGDVAQVEDVHTLTAHRNRGVARAMVSLATDLARAPFTFMCAGADDWPRELYEKLGYDPVGCVTAFNYSDDSSRRPPA